MDLEKDNVNRREFLSASAIAAAAMATAPVFGIAGKADAQTSSKSLFICGVCGHVEFGAVPDNCPVCHAPKEKFSQNNNIFDEAQSGSSELGVSHTPVITVMQKSELIPEMYVYEVRVRVGAKVHSMEDAHHIRFIDCYVDDRHFTRALFTTGSLPAAVFFTRGKGSKIRAVEACTVHGFWQAEAQVS